MQFLPYWDELFTIFSDQWLPIGLKLFSTMLTYGHCAALKIYMLFSFFFFSVENENHSDFTKLREMLIRTNMEDLRDCTHTKHYEVYRKNRLQEVREQG